VVIGGARLPQVPFPPRSLLTGLDVDHGTAAELLPQLESSPGGHARTPAEFLRKVLPRQTRLEDKQSGVQHLPVVQGCASRMPRSAFAWGGAATAVHSSPITCHSESAWPSAPPCADSTTV